MIPKSIRYICIHGHFYQPPRENPWLEAIEVQESAHPFHDWNERITRECYAPNTQARILDERGRLRDVINNFEHISFNFGPTLLIWLESHAAETYQAILRADAVSRQRRSGHGNALAQAYHHMIMPLASGKDKITQVLWGIRDFRKRFRRDPEGMWLPETAVDNETLGVLADNGILFTILAPRQASRFRTSRHAHWTPVDAYAVDCTQPYLCRLSGARSIALFFFDAPISHAIAFEKLLNDGKDFKRRLMAGFSDEQNRPQLVHVATDGESYGHHHRFGEMALGYAIQEILGDRSVRLTNYGEFLTIHPPVAEAEFIENSSWSCVHGVGRWSEDCGCSLSERPDWNQKWRVPLRKALDLLRDRVDRLFQEKASSLVQDPWVVRNDYIDALLGPPEDVHRFFRTHSTRRLNQVQRIFLKNLLEMQRNRMLMYTSCGWFFDDISGIEALQLLRYAARVLQIAHPLDSGLCDDFLKVLSGAVSNLKPHLTGDRIFTEKILPGVADLATIAAHVGISYLFKDPLFAAGKFFCYDTRTVDFVRQESGERVLLTGLVSVKSAVTSEQQEFIIAAIHPQRVDFRCSVALFDDKVKYDTLKAELRKAFLTESSTELIRKLDKYFPGKYFSLKDLFVEQRSQIIDKVTKHMYDEQAALLETFYEKNKLMARLIMDQGASVPDTFRAAAGFVLKRLFLKEMDRLARGEFPDQLESVLEESGFWRITVDLGIAEQLFSQRILALMKHLAQKPSDEITPSAIIRLIELSERLDIQVYPCEAQVLLLRIARSIAERGNMETAPALSVLAEKLEVRLDFDGAERWPQDAKP